MTILGSSGFREQLDQCVQCGLCLPACPTYEVFRTEMEAPRGRIALMSAAADGRIGLDGAFRRHIDLCLGCRSCETACPSGVRYGSLLEQAREAIEAQRVKSSFERLARWLALRQLLPHRRRLRWLARALRVVQALGGTRLAGKLSFLPTWVRRSAALLPALGKIRRTDRRPAPALGAERGTVALFRGCVQDAFLGGVNAATVRVLQRNGYEVHFPAGQTCCGAAALHLGETGIARELARRNVRAFDSGSYDAVVTNAGGCGALLREYAELLGADSAPTRRFVARVQDVSELLAGRLVVPEGTAPEGTVPTRATYVDSCHLRHAQRVVDAPRDLLRQVPGLELVELQRPDFCCGSAGVYNLTQPEAAERVLDLKMEDVRATGARMIVTTNPGCQMQLAYGVARDGLDAEVLHLMELLDRAYGPPPTARAL